MGKLFWSIHGPLNAIPCIVKRGRQREIRTHRKGEDSVSVEAEVGMMRLQAKEGQLPQETERAKE